MRLLLTLFVMCVVVMTFAGMLHAEKNTAECSELPDQTILAHIRHDDKLLTCRIVAKQKIFDGSYKVYYTKTLPDGNETVKSINLIQVGEDDWVVNESGML